MGGWIMLNVALARAHRIAALVGIASDYADKATGKAQSMAMKTALLEGFSIPTQDTPDGDRDTAVGDPLAPSSEERRGGQECVRTCSSRGSPRNSQKKTK